MTNNHNARFSMLQADSAIDQILRDEEKLQHYPQIDAVLERLAHILNCKNDTELAKSLCVGRTTISSWRSRNSIPYYQCVVVAINKDVLLDWIITGRGAKEKKTLDLAQAAISDEANMYRQMLKMTRTQHAADRSFFTRSVFMANHPDHRAARAAASKHPNIALAAARRVATFFNTYIWSNPMSDKYHSEATQRTLRILLLLGGHEINGLAPGEIAKSLGIPPSQTTRLLANLRIAGVAEQLPETERWRLAPRIVQIAIAHMHGIDKAQSKLDETKNRFSRNPN